MEKRCDECGRPTPKYHRIHKGSGYCASCYARLFKPRRCPGCNEIARLHVGEPEALCRRCERNVPCVRCGKLNYAIGRMTPYGPVCNSCSVYFREERRCAICGKLSRRLSRISRLGVEEPICPACQRKDRGTCFRCHRDRLLFDDGTTGHRVCKKCRDGGIVPCPRCHQPMPAGRGLSCERCYWTALAVKRAATASEVFPVREHAEIFRDFAEWLCGEIGERKAAITLLRYLPFFVEVASLGTRTPPYPKLLQHFSATGLRRNLLPMRFFEAKVRVVVDEQQKQDNSDQRRILATLSSVPSMGRFRELLDQYHTFLRLKLVAGKTRLRSVRLSLTPAAALVSIAAKAGHALPEQDDLSQYLGSTPGQRAAVTGFVNFLREACHVPLQMPVKKEGRDPFLVRRKLEWSIAQQLRSDLWEPSARTALLANALRYFHHMPVRAAKQVATTGALMTTSDGRTFVSHSGNEFWLPAEVSAPLIAALASRIPDLT